MIAHATSTETIVLLVRAGSRLCAIPIGDVAETMRPLETEPIPMTPRFLLGLAIIRGSPVPVVALGELLRANDDTPFGRYVLLIVGDRKIAIAVESVLGVHRLEGSLLQGLPLIMQEADQELVASIGMKDKQLLVVLRTARMIPDEVWDALRKTNERGNP